MTCHSVNNNIRMGLVISLSSNSNHFMHACMFITFVGSTSRAGICVACLKLTTLGRRIVNRLYHFVGFFTLCQNSQQ